MCESFHAETFCEIAFKALHEVVAVPELHLFLFAFLLSQHCIIIEIVMTAFSFSVSHSVHLLRVDIIRFEFIGGDITVRFV